MGKFFLTFGVFGSPSFKQDCDFSTSMEIHGRMFEPPGPVNVFVYHENRRGRGIPEVNLCIVESLQKYSSEKFHPTRMNGDQNIQRIKWPTITRLILLMLDKND